MAAGFAVLFFSVFLVVATEDCERDKSRTVRNIVYQEMAPLYLSVGSKIPYKCPFYKDRDRYLGHEEHKEREAPSRWSCNYCGKAFIGEIYLDKHLESRHAAYINTDADSVCLSDYCEIFRCDVHSGIAKPTFWDSALCMEEDMKDLAQDCQELFSGCLPESLHWNASKTLLASLTESVCSYLTCKKYYDKASYQEEEPPGISYVVLSILLGAGLIIYYCIAVNYFWLDTFSEIYEVEDSIRRNPNSLFSEDTMEKMPPPLRMAQNRTNVVQSEFSSTNKDVFNTRKRLDDMAMENGIGVDETISTANEQKNKPSFSKKNQSDELFTLRNKREHKFSRRSKEKSKSPSPNSGKSRSKSSLEKEVVTIGPSDTLGEGGMFQNVDLQTQEEQLQALSEAGAKFMEKVRQQSQQQGGETSFGEGLEQ